MADAAATLETIKEIQGAIKVLYMLALTAYQYPPECTVTNAAEYDYIIVGGGTAGSTLANRLSASNSVLLVEAGGYAPLECDMPGLFTLHPSSFYDYDFTSENDGYTAQNSQQYGSAITQGKMLGGTSSLNHMLYVQGDPNDYNRWAKLLNDDSWNYTNIRPFLKKIEKLVDEEILASPFADNHGLDGPIKIARQPSPMNANYLSAYEELGSEVVLDTTSSHSSLGFTEPLFAIADGVRQSNALCYLGPIKNRTCLCLKLQTTVTKIIIENKVAVGVQMIDSENNSYNVYANKEVIVTAGAINSPKLLMLSGIGPQAHLESFGIEVIADLPVGQNYIDHPNAVVIYQMEKAEESDAAVNPHQMPVPVTVGYVALNSSQTYPNYQVMNLLFSPSAPGLLQLCANSFKFSNEITQKIYDASEGRNVVMVINNLMMPLSRGEVLLASADYKDYPIIYTGAYSNPADVESMAESLADFHRILNTSYFKSVNASMADLGVCEGETGIDFWKCYAVALSSPTWHFCGTCAMGSVLDTNLRVKGINNLIVADSSAMPLEISGNILSAVTMIAEKASVLILADNE